MKTLVTGGAGFIGSNLVDTLIERGDEVAIVDNLSTGRHTNIEPALAAGAQLHEIDITHPQALDAVFAAERPEAVFHLAAQIDVRRSVQETAFDAHVNVEGTINVLNAARAAAVKRVVFVSTGGAIYGEADALPVPETAAIRPLAPYGQSKFAGEGYCHLYRRLHGLSTVCLRLGNVFGPRQDPLGEAGVIAIFCGKLQEGAAPVIFGDGSQTRDYIYVSDVVAALLAGAGTDVGGSYNIGTGRETSVLDLIDSLERLSDGKLLDPEHHDPRPGEVQRSALDATLARERLGWQANVEIDEGMRRTLASL